MTAYLEGEDLHRLREPLGVGLEVGVLHVNNALDLRTLPGVQDVFQLGHECVGRDDNIDLETKISDPETLAASDLSLEDAVADGLLPEVGVQRGHYQALAEEPLITLEQVYSTNYYCTF